MSATEIDPAAEIRAFMDRMMPREARWRYFQKGCGPMFVWTVEPFNTRYGDPRADGKYESCVYVPTGRGSKSGRAEQWKYDESSSMLHALRKDAKARALRLFREWEASQT